MLSNAFIKEIKMIKTDSKYADGSYRYWHSCKSCGYEKAYLGRLNKVSTGCPICNPRSNKDRYLKRVSDTITSLKINTLGVCKESLEEIFTYHKEGVLTYKVTIGSKAQKGTIAGTANSTGHRVLSLLSKKYAVSYLIWVYHFDSIDVGTPIFRINRVISDTRIENLTLQRHVKSNKDFILDACLVHKFKYDYSKTLYTHNKDNVIITCKEHGDFEQEAHSHLLGHGCQRCAKTGFKKTQPGKLYYLRLDSVGMYKIGITNNSVEDRFNKIDLETITVLKIWEYIDGNEAYIQEQKILKEFNRFRYKGSNILSSGNSEIFTHDVLGIDLPSI